MQSNRISSLLFVCLAWAGLCGQAAEAVGKPLAGPGPFFTIEAKVMVFPVAKPGVTQDPGSKAGDKEAAPAHLEMKSYPNSPYSLKMEAKGDGTTVLSNIDEVVAVGGETLAAPRCTVPASETASIAILTEAINYLIPAKDGLLEAKTLPQEQSPGIFLKAKLDNIQKDTVDLDLGFLLNVMNGREPIPGYPGIPWGRPIMKSTSVNAKFATRFGKWAIIKKELKDVATDKKEQLFIMLRVIEVDITGKPLHPTKAVEK